MMWRNPFQPYSPAVLAFTFAMLALACFAFFMAFSWVRTPLATWGGDDRA